MYVATLNSGSNGNSVYVEADGLRLLFDAGISGKQAALRLESLGRDISECDALFISHDHRDHVSCAGIYHRKFGIPVYATPETWGRSIERCSMGAVSDLRPFTAGSTIRINDVKIHTISTPHDAVDGVAFVVEAEGLRLGILTDLGHVFDALPDTIQSLDAVVLESNYDPDMLDGGWYPEFLKARIRGPRGHIANCEAAGLLSDNAGEHLQWICLAHLSEENNQPDLALSTNREILGTRFDIHVASRAHPVELPELG